MRSSWNIFPSFWVRKLTGQTRVPYDHRFRVRGSAHPIDYDAGLSLLAAESNALRIQSDLRCPERLTAVSTAFMVDGKKGKK